MTGCSATTDLPATPVLAYENAIKEGAPLMISPDSDFFKYFRNKDGR